MLLTPNPTRTLGDFTGVNLMLPKLQGRSMPDVMRELSQPLQQENSSLPDIHHPALQALNCELLTSLLLDLGATCPHLSVAPLAQSRFALGRANAALPWRAPVLPPIDLVFLILEPLPTDLESWQLINTLQSLGKNRLRLDDVRRAATSDEMLAVLAGIPFVPVSELPPLPRATAAPHHRAGTASGYHRRWRH